MIETHPFGSFIPSQVKYLLLGSFTTKEAYDTKWKGKYLWFYSNGRNQFWPILETVYGIPLKTRAQMESLFTDLRMALADIIYQCERKNNSNLDINLTSIVYAVEDITNILENNTIETVFFTSRNVEDKFRRVFRTLVASKPELKLVTLPSPSPRFTMKLAEKIEQYKTLLPSQD